MTAAEASQVKKPIPPDGGWGWMIVLGFSMSNLIVIPILQGFGLLYRDLFQTLGITATDMGIIINTNSSFGYLLGLMNGPILRTFGYRKVAIFGGVILFTGNLCTSFATSFVEFIIYYGLISSLGFNLVMNSFNLALNTYFVQKRSTATGLAMTFTGLGPVIMPLIISLLMSVYGVRGTSMLLAGLSLHSIMGSMLLHPVKWHYKKEINDAEINTDKQVENVVTDDRHSLFEGDVTLVPRRLSSSSDGMATERIKGEVRRNRGSSVYASKNSLSVSHEVMKPDSTWWTNSRTSLSSISLQCDGSLNTNEIKTVNSTNKLSKEAEELNTLLRDQVKKADDVIKSSNNKLNHIKETWYHKVIRFFDLDLLKDPGYLSICIGLSIALTGEFNFSLMTPFIFGDRDFDTKNTAIIMSVIGTADIISRFCSPFIGNRTKWSAKNLYLLSLVFLMITRFTLTLVSSYEATLVVAVCLGIAKGLRTIYMVLVLPNYVPLEKLASASGLQAMINGICLLSIGPIIGYVRDLTGNYNYCIHIMNLLTLTTIVLWTCELIYVKTRRKEPLQST